MLEKLRYLIALAQARHFTQAADLCGITQASLSNGIRSLEHMLGTVLVNRSGGFRGFTPEGERALMWAHRIVAHVREMEKEVRDVSGASEARLRIGVIPPVIPLLSKAIVPFLTRYPNTHLTVLVRPSKEIFNMLQAGEIDIGLTYMTGEFKIISVPIEMPQFVLATTPAGPLGKAETVTWKQVAAIPLCLLGRQSEDRQLIDEIFRRMKVQARPIFEADCIETLIARVQLGHFAALIPYPPAGIAHNDKGIRMIPVSEPHTLHLVCAIAREDIPTSSTAAAFLNELSKNGDRRAIGPQSGYEQGTRARL